jgi:glycosyltransferase involved in cell wall biosynthesis
MFNQWSRRYSRFAVPRVVQAAAAVITISEFTKQEVIDVLGTSPEKVHAIPIAVEEPFTPDGPRAEGDYVLSVGTLEPRKNLARVVEASQRGYCVARRRRVGR